MERFVSKTCFASVVLASSLAAAGLRQPTLLEQNELLKATDELIAAENALRQVQNLLPSFAAYQGLLAAYNTTRAQDEAFCGASAKIDDNGTCSGSIQLTPEQLHSFRVARTSLLTATGVFQSEMMQKPQWRIYLSANANLAATMESVATACGGNVTADSTRTTFSCVGQTNPLAPSPTEGTPSPAPVKK